MFRIKICGVTSADDARAVLDAGADAIGLNFYPNSPRYVSPENARGILADLPAALQRVGVFVDANPDEVEQLVHHLGLDYVQLHGDEPIEHVVLLARHVPVIRAFRVRSGDWPQVETYLRACWVRGTGPQAVLVDAFQSGQYGGTGATADWAKCSSQRERLQHLWGGSGVSVAEASVRFLLAGGLTPSNVAEAIRQVQPWGVDTASGVESAPGRKDPARVRAFVTAARAALEQLDRQ